MDEKEKIFNELYAEYHDDIFKYTLTYTESTTKADDITHEAFTRLWLKWDTLYQSKPIQNKVWLIRAVKNLLREDYHETQRVGTENISEKADYIEGGEQYHQ